MKSFSTVFLSTFLLIGVIFTTNAVADSDSGYWFFSRGDQAGVAPVTNANYKEECGACHFAYQPGLLPTRSWQKLLSAKALEDHFGENAELDEDTLKELLDYAISQAADKSSHKRSRKMNASIKTGETPLRITEVSYFRKEHREIPKRLIADNAKVKSLSNCDACHQKAAEGIFEEDTINIPGHGRWDD